MAKMSTPSITLMLFAALLTIIAASWFEDKDKNFHKSLFKLAETGKCSGEKMDWMKTKEWFEKSEEACRKKNKNLVDTNKCTLKTLGYFQDDSEPIEDEKKLAASIEKKGYFSKSFPKNVAEKIFASKCNKKLSKNEEQGLMCYMQAIIRACGGKM